MDAGAMIPHFSEDEIPPGTFHGGDEIPPGTFHGGDEISTWDLSWRGRDSARNLPWGR